MLPVKLNPFGINVKRLPYDREVEYLESTGTQWIDTGVLMGTNSSVSIKCTATKTETQFLFGVFGGQTFAVAAASSGKWIYDRGNQNTRISSSSNVIVNQITEITASKNILIVNDITTTGSAITVNPTNHALLFAWDRRPFDGSIQGGNFRIYYCKTSAESVSINRDFIPVRTPIEGKRVGAMYDRANPSGGPNGNGMYYNQGSGDFIIGPDL